MTPLITPLTALPIGEIMAFATPDIVLFREFFKLRKQFRILSLIVPNARDALLFRSDQVFFRLLPI